MFAVERLEHRLALSASLAWVDATNALAASQPADPPAQVGGESASIDALLVSRVAAQPWQRASIAPLPVVFLWPNTAPLEVGAGASAASPAAFAGAVARLPILSESFDLGSVSRLSRFAQIKQDAGFDFARLREPITIIFDRLPLGNPGGVDQGETGPAPHDTGSSVPHEGAVKLPAFDGAVKPGNHIDFEGSTPGMGAVPVAGFVAAGSDTTHQDSTSAANVARVTPDSAAGSTTAAAAAAELTANPFASLLGAVAGGEASAVRWLLPYVGSGGAMDAAGDSEAAGATESGLSLADGATPRVPGVASAALGTVADAGQALGMMAADHGPRAVLLGSVSLSTEALDQALQSVMSEVELLSGEFLTWIDEASIESWARSAAALAAVGLGGAIVWQSRGKRWEGEHAEAESATWLFHQLQSSTGGL